MIFTSLFYGHYFSFLFGKYFTIFRNILAYKNNYNSQNIVQRIEGNIFMVFYNVELSTRTYDIVLQAYVRHNKRYLHFTTIVSLLRQGALQNSHCVALPGTIAAHASSQAGQFLCSLVSDHSA